MIDHLWKSMKGFEETRIYLLRYSEYSCRCGRVEEIRRGGTKERERERERMIWRTWNATAADTTRVSIKPPQARKSRDVEIPAATGVPSGGGAGRPNSLCLWYNDPPSFSPRLCFPQPPPPPYIYGRSTCTSGYAGEEEGWGLLNRGIDFRLKYTAI